MASGRPIDHVVLAVRDLGATAAIYQELGFTLTPRAAHEDRMGTSNRLAQFKAQNFIELLEVDRPETLAPHDFTREPPFFSFGDHNRRAVADRDGLSMLVFAGHDARADIDKFKGAGLPTFAPFDFQRLARQPDGTRGHRCLFAGLRAIAGHAKRGLLCLRKSGAGALLEARVPRPCQWRHGDCRGVFVVTGAGARCRLRRQDVRRRRPSPAGRRLPGGLRTRPGAACAHPARPSPDATARSQACSRPPRVSPGSPSAPQASMV